MATYFVVSDVHSYFDQMMEALNGQGFDINNKNHIFVSLGDLLDRGPNAIKCLEFVNNLPKNRKILIKGNHEDLMLVAIQRKYFEGHDYHNGTVDTAEQITNMYSEDGYSDEEILYYVKHNILWQKYINSCIDYYETEKYIFVHGWVPCTATRNMSGIGYIYSDFTGPGTWRNPVWKDDWENARWINGMEAWSHGVRIEEKTIFCGHWHTSWGHSKLHHVGTEWDDKFSRVAVELGYLSPKAKTAHFEPFKDKGICAIDSCCAYSGKINCIKLGKQPKVVINETDNEL